MAFINYITQVQLDFGAVKLLPQECERIGIRRPLIVTDIGVRAAGVLDKALAALGTLPHAVFDQTPSNPTEAAVHAAARLFKDQKCDGLIAVGGGSSIETATRNGSDRRARWNMMSASMQGAMAFQKGLGCVHSLSHSLGGVNPRLHHGTLNAMFLPAVVRFNASAESIVADRRLARLAHAMGIGRSDAAGTEIAEALREMNARLGLPSGLAAMGVERGWFDRIIDGALADHCHKTNPRIASREEYREMLEASM